MIEGGLQSFPSCESTIVNCSTPFSLDKSCCVNTKTVLTKLGPCHQISFTRTAFLGQKSAKLGFYLSEAKNDLNLSLELSGTSSFRVGFPLVSAGPFFAQGFICPEAFGDIEADIMCKQLGFTGGER